MYKALFWALVSCAFGQLAICFALLANLFANQGKVAPTEPPAGAEALAVVERDEGSEGDERLLPFEPVGGDEDGEEVPVGAEELSAGDAGGDDGRDGGDDGCECGCRGSDCGCVHAAESTTGGDGRKEPGNTLTTCHPKDFEEGETR